MVAARPLRALDSRVARYQSTRAVVSRKLTLYRANAHLAVTAVGLAVLVRRAGLKTERMGPRQLEVHFPLPGRFGESHLMRPV